MVGDKEFDPEAAQENTGLQDFEDAEETFSFSDLSLKSCDTYWDNIAKQDRSSAFDRRDFFEFFSEEFTVTASSTNSSDSIIFCGKLIPYKGEAVVAAETEQNLEIAAPETVVAETEKNLEIAAQTKHTKKGSIFPSKQSLSFNKSTERAAARINTSPKKEKQEKSDRARESTYKGYATGKLSVDRKYDCSMRKGPNLSPLMKSGCYSFRLGAGKFPMEMDLSDIKMRQSKMRQSKKNPTPARMFLSDDECDQTEKSSKGKREKNLWGLFRGKASLGCVPQVGVKIWSQVLFNRPSC